MPSHWQLTVITKTSALCEQINNIAVFDQVFKNNEIKLHAKIFHSCLFPSHLFTFSFNCLLFADHAMCSLRGFTKYNEYSL